jgi:predicted nucleic acid-binding protein
MNHFTIVDTDILIDVGWQVTEAIHCINQLEGVSTLAISSITQMELLIGCRNKVELQNMEHFLMRFQVLKLNESITDIAVALLRQYRLSHGLAMPDALIAATALGWGQPFITKNQRDYRFISTLQLLPYPNK